MPGSSGYFLRRITPGLSSILDATRAVAAGLVVIHHANHALIRPWDELGADGHTFVNALLSLVTRLGPPSVLVFFVLSGFLVGGGLIGNVREGSFNLRAYLLARVSRLFIVLLPALALGALWDGIGAHWRPGGYLKFAAAMDLGTLFGNTAFLQTILVPTFGTNTALWSLANEFWYYLLWPCLVLPLLPATSGRLRTALALAAGAILLLTFPLIALYSLLWIAGALVRCCPTPLVRWPWLSWAFLALMVAGQRLTFGVASEGWHVAGDFAIGLAFANALLTHQHRPRPELPGARFFKLGADFSYSLYLLHMPFLYLLKMVLWQTCGLEGRLPPGMLAYGLMLALIAAAYAYAWGVSWLTERHTAAVRSWLAHRLGVAR